MVDEALGREVSRGTLWFGQLGGAVAWVLHLIGTYAISEWGCESGFARQHWLGITASCWLLFAATALAGTLAALAALSGLHGERCLRRSIAEGVRGPIGDSRHGGIYLGRSGAITSGLFLLIIAAQTVPPFFFLRQC